MNALSTAPSGASKPNQGGRSSQTQIDTASAIIAIIETSAIGHADVNSSAVETQNTATTPQTWNIARHGLY